VASRKKYKVQTNRHDFPIALSPGLALKVVTEEQLMAIASQPIKRSKKAAKQAKPSQSSKPNPITSFFNKKS
jgi:hypothetical protein